MMAGYFTEKYIIEKLRSLLVSVEIWQIMAIVMFKAHVYIYTHYEQRKKNRNSF